MTPDQSLFEAKFCGRCGGSGKFSFNLMDGDRCFGCRGTGVQLTARGKAAKAFYVESQKMPVSELKPGMFLWDDMMGKVAKFLPILSIKQSGSCQIVNGERRYYIEIETKRGGHGVFPDSMVRAVRSEEERRAQVAAALEYQGTLTKQGKPSKRASLPLAA